MAHPQRVAPGPGEESVWDYPRPPRVEPSRAHIVVHLARELVAETRESLRVLETSHPPVHYIPPQHVRMEGLARTSRRTFCEFKGEAVYWATPSGDELAWSYPRPARGYEALTDHLAFYPSRVAVTLDGERVQSQAGGFYGGWITARVVGPFKGEAGTRGW